MKNKRGSTTEIGEHLTPISAIEALRRNLLYNILDSVDGASMREIVKVQVKKAKEGDAKAAKLIFDMVQGPGYIAGRDLNISHTNIEFVSDARRMMVNVIAEQGPQRPEELAKKCHMLLPDVMTALNHQWFDKAADGWHVTDEARTEVVG